LHTLTDKLIERKREREREGGREGEWEKFFLSVYLLLFALNSAAFFFAHALASSLLVDVTAFGPLAGL
jgi:hypothetical protein